MNSIILSENEMIQLENDIADAISILTVACIEKYNEVCLCRFRDEYKNSLKHGTPFDINPSAKKKMHFLMSKEEFIISAFYRQIHKRSYSFQNGYGQLCHLPIEDYIQESTIGVYNGMYTYNGEVKLLTYLTNCINNALIAFVQNNSTMIKVGRNIKSLDSKVARIMRMEGLNREQAVEKLRVSLKLSSAVTKRLLEYTKFVKTVSIDSNDGEKSFNFEPSFVENQQSTNMYEVIELAYDKKVLDDLEYGLVKAVLDHDTSYRTRKVQEINPNTGNTWTRQRLSQKYLDALKKIKDIVQSIS